MKELNISVIIPVFNAEKFVIEAVESAVSLSEVTEILLIEDGSPDKALDVCLDLTEKYNKVKLFQHPNGENRGAGISRNLGIEKAKCDWVAFLDADDFYLPDRFIHAKNILRRGGDVDGVYEAAGTSFVNEEARNHWESIKFKVSGNLNTLTTVTELVSPNDLFYKIMPFGSAGYFSLNGLLIKKSALLSVGCFPNLRMFQDTVLISKLVAKYKLLPGSIEKPIAMRRVHSDNRINSFKNVEKKPFFNSYPSIGFKNRMLMWLEIWKWGKKNFSKSQRKHFKGRFIKFLLIPFTNRKREGFFYPIESLTQVIWYIWYANLGKK
ncbi:glycosyltransferase family 2 protein [Marivirga harenae]|uniref:glycosyltransferase family 2 protein n=1 Tax=Marivirga harenae TaxID=2010992 RepID=UPI0026DF5542|nr:glycosyltransferase family 2 protein [Marivirga harenae]WKV11358.1 glycosyltransferase family 2 protein [Marivirga harenae]